MLCEVDPNKQLYSDSSTHSSDGSDMEYSSAASDEEHSTVSSRTGTHTMSSIYDPLPPNRLPLILLP